MKQHLTLKNLLYSDTCVSVSNAKTIYHNVDEGDEKDSHSYDVIQNICNSLVGIFVDIHSANDKEQNTDNYLLNKNEYLFLTKLYIIDFSSNGHVLT